MVDLVDKGEAELQQLTQKVAMQSTDSSVRASLWVGKGVVGASFKAAQAIYGAMHHSINKHRESGQVSLKQFTLSTEGKRELLNIDNPDVAKQLQKELRRHGVLWSVEHHQDGSRTFHIQGKDAELVQHALSVAAERIDQNILTKAQEAGLELDGQHEEQAQAQTHSSEVDEGEPEEQAQAQTRSTEVNEGETVEQTQASKVTLEKIEAAEHAYIEQRVESQPEEQTQAQTRSSEVDEGEPEKQTQAQTRTADVNEGETVEQAKTQTRSADRPEQTPRDRTRAFASEKIDTDVKQKKISLDDKAARTKVRTPGQQPGSEPDVVKGVRR